MIHYECLWMGQAFALRYDFECAGDAIPTHAHAPDLAHNVIVLKGALRIIDTFGERDCPAGSIQSIDWKNPHTIIALEPNSSGLHVFLNGQPEGYDRLTETDLKGTL